MNFPIMLVSKHYKIVARMDKIFSKNNAFNMKLLKSSEKDLEESNKLLCEVEAKNDTLIYKNVQLIKQIDEYRKQSEVSAKANKRSILASLLVGAINGAVLALLLVI